MAETYRKARVKKAIEEISRVKSLLEWQSAHTKNETVRHDAEMQAEGMWQAIRIIERTFGLDE